MVATYIHAYMDADENCGEPILTDNLQNSVARGTDFFWSGGPILAGFSVKIGPVGLILGGPILV